MLMGKTNNTVPSGYASYWRDTETAKVEDLWLSVDTQMTVIAAAKVPWLSYTLLLYFPPSLT